MTPNTQLLAFGHPRLPLRAPVRVFGKPGLITGRAFAYERYDVQFADGSTQHSLSREHLELDWSALHSPQATNSSEPTHAAE